MYDGTAAMDRGDEKMPSSNETCLDKQTVMPPSHALTRGILPTEFSVSGYSFLARVATWTIHQTNLLG